MSYTVEAKAPSNSTITAFTNRITGLTGTLRIIEEKIKTLANQTTGPIPESDSDKTGYVEPPTLIIAINSLEDQIAAIEVQVSRLYDSNDANNLR